MKPFGMRAMMSLRLDKSFGSWLSEFSPDYTAAETGLDRFVKLNKSDFIGKSALEARVAKGPTRKLVTLRIDTTDRPATPGSSIMVGDRVAGTVTSGDWGHRVGMNLAYAFIEPELAAPGTRLELDLIGDRISAEVIAPCPYDPQNQRVHS